MYTYVHTNQRTYIHAYQRTYICTCICTYIPTYLPTYIHTFIHTCIRTYVHTCVHTYIHTYIHTYFRGRAFTCVDVFVPSSVLDHFQQFGTSKTQNNAVCFPCSCSRPTDELRLQDLQIAYIYANPNALGSKDLLAD